MNQTYNFSSMSWDEFYEIFHDLPNDKKLLGAMAMQDFSAKDEVVEIIFQLAEFPNAEHFIFKALDNGITLRTSDIEELILFDNKNLNRRLVFENLHRLRENTAIDEFEYLEDYMHREDYKKLKQQMAFPAQQEKKAGLFATAAGALLIAEGLNAILDEDE